MQMPLYLPMGSHELSDEVVDWQVTFDPSAHPPRAKLTASIATGPNPPPSPILGPTGTILVIQTDARAAMQLYERLGNLGRSMGWLPQKEA
jgi:hypothetical protein